MKSFGMWKIPMVLTGLGAALLFSPACKAQEVTSDHFTDTGVQNVYEGTPSKAVAPKAKKMAPAQQAEARKANSAPTLQPAAQRSSTPASQPKAQAVADKRKPAPSTPKDPQR